MQKIEDVLTGIMLIVSTVIAVGIAFMGVFLFMKSSSLILLSLIFALVFLALYTLRVVFIGLSIMIHGRYREDVTI